MLRILFVGLIALAAAAGLMGYLAPSSKPTASSAPPAIAVTTVPAAARDVPVLLTGIGAVQALNTVQIRSRVDGVLDQVNFKEGEHVKQGDVLAIIDPRLYEAALDQAKAKLAQDQAQLVTDEKDLERSRQLSQQKFASQQTVDQLTAKVGVDRALIEADRAYIRTAETNLSYTAIAAPFAGRIGLRAVDPGNIVKANDTASPFIATLTQQHPIGLVFTLPESQLSAVRQAEKAGEVRVIALDQEGKTPIAKGKLQVIDNLVDQTTGTSASRRSSTTRTRRSGPVNTRPSLSRSASRRTPSRSRRRRFREGRTGIMSGSRRPRCAPRWRRWKRGRSLKASSSLRKA